MNTNKEWKEHTERSVILKIDIHYSISNSKFENFQSSNAAFDPKNVFPPKANSFSLPPLRKIIIFHTFIQIHRHCLLRRWTQVVRIQVIHTNEAHTHLAAILALMLNRVISKRNIDIPENHRLAKRLIRSSQYEKLLGCKYLDMLNRN